MAPAIAKPVIDTTNPFLLGFAGGVPGVPLSPALSAQDKNSPRSEQADALATKALAAAKVKEAEKPAAPAVSPRLAVKVATCVHAHPDSLIYDLLSRFHLQLVGEELVIPDGRRFPVYRSSTNSSGFEGVYGTEGRWLAAIRSRPGEREESVGLFQSSLEAALAYTRAEKSPSSAEGSQAGSVVAASREECEKEHEKMLALYLELVRCEEKRYPGVYHALLRAMELCAKELKTPEAALKCVAEALNGHEGLAQCFEALLPGGHMLPVLAPIVLPPPRSGVPKVGRPLGSGKAQTAAKAGVPTAARRKRPMNTGLGVGPVAGFPPVETSPPGGKRSRIKKDYAAMAAGAALPSNMK